MRFLGLGVPELIVILIIVLLIFGPKNLPKLGSAIGRTVKGLREGMDGKSKEQIAQPEQTQATVADAQAEPSAQASRVQADVAETAAQGEADVVEEDPSESR